MAMTGMKFGWDEVLLGWSTFFFGVVTVAWKPAVVSRCAGWGFGPWWNISPSRADI